MHFSVITIQLKRKGKNRIKMKDKVIKYSIYLGISQGIIFISQLIRQLYVLAVAFNGFCAMQSLIYCEFVLFCVFLDLKGPPRWLA